MKEYIESGNAGVIAENTIKKVFPELAELEDDKIRGAIIYFISHTPTVPKGIIGKKTMIAWLEKQGEQKPADKVNVLMSLDEAIEHCKEKSCGNSACALEHKQLEKWLTELKELKEQKSIEQDTETHDLWVYIREWNDKFGRLPKDEDELAACIDYVMKRQKPAWSDEDERRINHIIAFMSDEERIKDTERMFPIEEDVRWLKSLKDRLK